MSTSHKESRGLRQRLRKKAIYGWKLGRDHGEMDLGQWRGLTMKVNCGEYRKTMQLLGLKQRLKEEGLSPKERRGLEKRIRELEKELRLD